MWCYSQRHIEYGDEPDKTRDLINNKSKNKLNCLYKPTSKLSIYTAALIYTSQLLTLLAQDQHQISQNTIPCNDTNHDTYPSAFQSSLDAELP